MYIHIHTALRMHPCTDICLCLNVWIYYADMCTRRKVHLYVHICAYMPMLASVCICHLTLFSYLLYNTSHYTLCHCVAMYTSCWTIATGHPIVCIQKDGYEISVTQGTRRKCRSHNVIWWIIFGVWYKTVTNPWTLLLTWINCNPSRDEWSHPL